MEITCKNVYSAVFLNRRFHSLERLVFYIKREKSFFQDLLSRCITWGYKGLQGVLKSYKGFEEGTRGYKFFNRANILSTVIF